MEWTPACDRLSDRLIQQVARWVVLHAVITGCDIIYTSTNSVRYTNQ